MPAGLFVAFEGPDSVGKTTQQDLVATRLGDRSYKMTGFSDGVTGSALRDLRKADWFMRMGPCYGLAETALFLSELMYRTQRSITPRLSEDKHVLKDRYLLTVLAYQAHFLKIENNMDPSELFDLASGFIREGGLVVPDLTVVLHADLEIILPRIEEKDRRKINFKEREQLEGSSHMFEAYRESYTTIADKHNKKVVYIDTGESDAEGTCDIVLCALEGLL